MTTSDTPPPVQWLREQKAAYAHGEHRPEGSFTAIMAAYAATVGGLGVLIRRGGHRIPTRLTAADLALVSVATHKLSRLLAKDPVTSPLRMPFTRFAGTSGEAELAEEVRGTGVRRAIGELVTCPFCLGLWVATGFGAGLVLRPDATRLAAFVLSSLTAADALQFAYSQLEQRATG
jgi:hypothetical protein